MEWIILIALLLFGVGLIISEVIFIPGTTLVGVLGFLCLVGGIYSAYESFGDRTGNAVMLSTGIFLLITIIYTLKSKTWKKMGIEGTMSSRVNDDREINVYPGCVVMTVSDLKPMGTIEFENDQYEAETNGEYISAKTPVKVISVNKHQIIVQKQTTES